MRQIIPTPVNVLSSISAHKWYRWALVLALITIFYNLAEGAISVWFGLHDESLALFGFGLDSFIEVISGFGILRLVIRLQQSPNEKNRSSFEKTALHITGIAFYLLVVGVGFMAIFSLINAHKPVTTFWGTTVSLLSLSTMYIVMRAKYYVGEQLNSAPIQADATCTRACLYMSFLLLASSLIYTWTGFPYIDSIGALGIMWFAWREGKEAFEKAANKETCCDGFG